MKEFIANPIGNLTGQKKTHRSVAFRLGLRKHHVE